MAQVSNAGNFQPILNDMRELGLTYGQRARRCSWLWTAARLKQALNRHCKGKRSLFWRTAEPYIHQYAADKSIEVQHPASGFGHRA